MNLSATRTTPGRPKINDDHLAGEIGKLEASFVDRCQLMIEETLGQHARIVHRWRDSFWRRLSNLRGRRWWWRRWRSRESSSRLCCHSDCENKDNGRQGD